MKATKIPNELSKSFADIEVRRKIIKEYGDSTDMFFGVNEDDENVYLSVDSENGITLTTHQKNGWVRVNYYDKDGYQEGETFQGRWK